MSSIYNNSHILTEFSEIPTMKRKRRFCWIGHSEKQQHIGKFFWKKTKEIMVGLKAQELRTHKSHANDMEGNMRDTKIFNYFFFTAFALLLVLQRDRLSQLGDKGLLLEQLPHCKG